MNCNKTNFAGFTALIPQNLFLTKMNKNHMDAILTIFNNVGLRREVIWIKGPQLIDRDYLNDTNNAGY
jgi:hypothetical protein